MRLDELEWAPSRSSLLMATNTPANFAIYRATANGELAAAGEYIIRDMRRSLGQWNNLDPLSAQCLLFELLGNPKVTP